MIFVKVDHRRYVNAEHIVSVEPHGGGLALIRWRNPDGRPGGDCIAIVPARARHVVEAIGANVLDLSLGLPVLPAEAQP